MAEKSYKLTIAGVDPAVAEAAYKKLLAMSDSGDLTVALREAGAPSVKNVRIATTEEGTPKPLKSEAVFTPAKDPPRAAAQPLGPATAAALASPDRGYGFDSPQNSPEFHQQYTQLLMTNPNQAQQYSHKYKYKYLYKYIYKKSDEVSSDLT